MRRILLILALLGIVSGRAASQNQHQVTVQIPPSAGFMVNDVSAVTQAAPFTIRLTNIKLRGPAKTIRIAVQAMSPTFTPPSGPAMPASLVFWTVGPTANGIGSGGVLSHTSFTNVVTTTHNAKNASAAINWNLAAPGPGIRAGIHTLTVNWRIEAF